MLYVYVTQVFVPTGLHPVCPASTASFEIERRKGLQRNSLERQAMVSTRLFRPLERVLILFHGVQLLCTITGTLLLRLPPLYPMQELLRSLYLAAIYLRRWLLAALSTLIRPYIIISHNELAVVTVALITTRHRKALRISSI